MWHKVYSLYNRTAWNSRALRGIRLGALAGAGARLKLSFKLSFEVLRPYFTQCVRGEAAAEVFEAGEGFSMSAAQSADAGA